MRDFIATIFNILSSKRKQPLAQAKSKSLLIVDDTLPLYDQSSGSRRLFELIKIFLKMDLNVIFIADDGMRKEPYYSQLQSMGVEVICEDRAVAQRLLNKNLNLIHYAWLSRPALNSRFQPRLNKHTKKIFDTVDLHYVRMLRQAEETQNPRLRKKALETKKRELHLARRSDITVTVTQVEKELLINEQIKNVWVVPNVHSRAVGDVSPFLSRKGILFIGGYKHEPNIDAALWLVNEIMPDVWKEDPDVELTLLGSDPTNEILNLRSGQVHVPGYVKDVSEYFINHRVFVAPLRYGAGMKGKLGQSFEYALPIVSTQVGVEGMGLVDGKHVLIADTAKSFANQVMRLYNDAQLWARLSSNSSEAISEYNPEAIGKTIKELIAHLDDQNFS
ncbi:glycosyltransferase [Pedobacter deserti]|uniref:glycosyltransferase n=1 Tax=Pedobacter deserti TaxID=2817382 RepID=UPI00210DA6FC|nr:glycosyltransferase family 4 protein [Pedobacter sp. SYSU D00382]